MKKYSQHINHQHIARLLTHSTEHLDGSIVSSLQQARAVALQKQRVHEPVFSLNAIGHRAHMPHTTNQWVAATILLAAIVVGAIGYWQNTQIPVDIEILTDDLPIEVFVDQHE
ncbi:MAG: DUF3619 family protein [Gallionella sp.]|nr:DUF3619 family protein [Gallionella sp.]